MTRILLVSFLLLLTVAAAPVDLAQLPPTSTRSYLPPDPIAPSPTGFPPGPSIKTVTQPSSTMSGNAAGTALAMAVGPAGAFDSAHKPTGSAVAAPISSGTAAAGGSTSTSPMGNTTTLSRFRAAGLNGTSTYLLDNDEEVECDDEPELSGPPEAAAAPPVPAGEGSKSNETIPLVPSPVKPDEKPAAAQPSQPSGMQIFMSAGGGIGGKMRRDLARAGEVS